MAVAPLDLASGFALLQTTQKQGFPWLSANLLDQNGLPLFQPTRIKKIGKIKAGIIGLTGALSSLPQGITRAEWQTILPALIEKTSHQCDILILLSSLSPAENQEIAQQFPALHLILAADLGGGNMNPQQVNNTLITQTDRQGKYQGLLNVDWNKSGRWGKAREEELNSLRNKLGALDWQLERMRTRKDLQQPEYIEKIKQAERDRETVDQQIMTLEQSPATASADGQNLPCSFTYNFLALQNSLAEAPEITALVTDIKRQIFDIHSSNKHR